jgi:hypothetical protein
MGYKRPAAEGTIKMLSTGRTKVEKVTLLGKNSQPVKFRQTAAGLVFALPSSTVRDEQPYTLRIEGTMPFGLQ